jgi:large subunit ribosomal protein L3
MGDARKTVQNLLIIGVRTDLNVILVKGAVPGSKNGIVVIKNAVKKS